MTNSLKFFFEPKSVAVIGASGTPGKAGNEILVDLVANGYPGRIFPINPSGEEIMGFPSYRSVKEIPEPVDLAVFIVPAEKTLGPLKECAAKKIPAAVIASGGYAEVDQQGAKLQEEILRVARSSGMRIIGPNTSGLTSTPASLTTTFFPLGKKVVVREAGVLVRPLVLGPMILIPDDRATLKISSCNLAPCWSTSAYPPEAITAAGIFFAAHSFSGPKVFSAGTMKTARSTGSGISFTER